MRPETSNGDELFGSTVPMIPADPLSADSAPALNDRFRPRLSSLTANGLSVVGR